VRQCTAQCMQPRPPSPNTSLRNVDCCRHCVARGLNGQKAQPGATYCTVCQTGVARHAQWLLCCCSLTPKTDTKNWTKCHATMKCGVPQAKEDAVPASLKAAPQCEPICLHLWFPAKLACQDHPAMALTNNFTHHTSALLAPPWPSNLCTPDSRHRPHLQRPCTSSCHSTSTQTTGMKPTIPIDMHTQCHNHPDSKHRPHLHCSKCTSLCHFTSAQPTMSIYMHMDKGHNHTMVLWVGSHACCKYTTQGVLWQTCVATTVGGSRQECMHTTRCRKEQGSGMPYAIWRAVLQRVPDASKSVPAGRLPQKRPSCVSVPFRPTMDSSHGLVLLPVTSWSAVHDCTMNACVLHQGRKPLYVPLRRQDNSTVSFPAGDREIKIPNTHMQADTVACQHMRVHNGKHFDRILTCTKAGPHVCMYTASSHDLLQDLHTPPAHRLPERTRGTHSRQRHTHVSSHHLHACRHQNHS
jgi:hypothetical protein